MNRRSQNPYESFAHKNTGKLRTPNASTDLFTRKKRRPPLMRGAALLLAALLCLLCVYNVFVNMGVRVESITLTLPKLPSAFEGYTILHISDLYGAILGQGQQKIADALSGRSYSAVCITGDMVSPSGDIQPFMDLLDVLGTKKPIYFIAGEQDPPSVMNDASQGDSVLAAYVIGALQRGATFLDAPVCVQSGGSSLWLTPESGLTLDADATLNALTARLAEQKQAGESGADAYVLRQALEYQIDRAQRIGEARAQMLDEDMCVVLTHAPLSADFVASSPSTGTGSAGSGNKLLARIDLVLAGHLNGGQANLPLIGPLYLPGRGLFPGTRSVSGVTNIGEVPQHISPGLGVNPANPIPFRLFNPPTITLIRLTAEL